jgi:hypothetical protein
MKDNIEVTILYETVNLPTLARKGNADAIFYQHYSQRYYIAI